MNSTTRTATYSAPTTRSNDGFFQRLVLRELAQLSCGQLRIDLPDCSVYLFGNQEKKHWHDQALAPAALAIPQSAAITVRRLVFFEKCALYGDVGFAESYLDGDWDTNDISAIITAPTLSGSRANAFGVNFLRAANRLKHLLRPNSRRIAALNIREHYDLSNDFFLLWLDPSMMYSGARWETPLLSLEEAQTAKNDALCRKLRLTATDHVLEIGTGGAVGRFTLLVTTVAA